VVTSPAQAVGFLWDYLIPCFPLLTTKELEASPQAILGQYKVKDVGTGDRWGVWSVRVLDGSVVAENLRAQQRDDTVRRSRC
jgi:hypothetical protein